MPPIIRLWLTTILLLGSLMLIWEGLAGTGISVALGQSTLAIFAFGCLLLIMRRWWDKTVGARLEPVSQMLSGIETGKAPNEPAEAGSDEISKLADLVHRVCSELNVRREAGRNSGPTIAATSPCRHLSGNVRLAADHVESIRALLEISQTHQQPIPRAAFQNLELVSKHLREIERQLDAGPETTNLESALQVTPACRDLLRPGSRRLSFECRTSPSDR